MHEAHTIAGGGGGRREIHGTRDRAARFRRDERPGGPRHVRRVVTRAAGEPDVNPKTKTRATAAARGYTLLTQQKDLTAPRCVGRHAFP